jgi:putative glycosyltransferase (TIGR04372 family)
MHAIGARFRVLAATVLVGAAYLLWWLRRQGRAFIFVPIAGHRIGHLALDIDLVCRENQTEAPGLREREEIFVIERAANEQLATMWRRCVPLLTSRLLYKALDIGRGYLHRTPWMCSSKMQSNHYALYQKTTRTLKFSLEELECGLQYLSARGLGPFDWYVCLFARDDAYLSSTAGAGTDWSYHAYRNADIESFRRAVELILAEGGFVFRVGSHVAKPFAIEHPRYIDYAQCDRTDFLDIYLLAHARFVLGTTSGIGDISAIFDVPRLGTNWAPIGNAPYGVRSLVTPKLLRHREDGRLLSFREALSLTSQSSNSLVWDGLALATLGLEYVDNTADELADATADMLRLFRGDAPWSEEELLRQQCYRHAFGADHWCADLLTPVAPSFLKRHHSLLYAESADACADDSLSSET